MAAPVPATDAVASMVVRIENHVLTAVLNTTVNLSFVAEHLSHIGAEYNPKTFAAVILRAQDRVIPRRRGDLFLHHLEPVQVHKPSLERVAVLVFHPGKLVCTGAKTEARALIQLERVAEALRFIGYENAVLKGAPVVHNIVGRSQLPCRVAQAEMEKAMPLQCTFDPKLFPGAILRHPWTEGITLLVFASGKIIVTGAKSIERAQTAIRRIGPVLMRFDKRNFEGDSMPPLLPVKTEAVKLETSVSASTALVPVPATAAPVSTSQNNIDVNRAVAEVLRDVRIAQEARRQAVEERRNVRVAEVRAEVQADTEDGSPQESPLKRRRL